MNILDEIEEFISQYHNPVLNALMRNLIEMEKNNINQLIELSSEVVDFVEKCKEIKFSEDLADSILDVLACLPAIFSYYFFQHLNESNSSLVSALLRYLLDMKVKSIVLSRYMSIEKAVILLDMLNENRLKNIETMFEV